MNLAVQCPQCGATAQVPAEFAGRKGRCAKCGYVMRIPAPAQAPEPEVELELEDPFSPAALTAWKSNPAPAPTQSPPAPLEPRFPSEDALAAPLSGPLAAPARAPAGSARRWQSVRDGLKISQAACMTGFVGLLFYGIGSGILLQQMAAAMRGDFESPVFATLMIVWGGLGFFSHLVVFLTGWSLGLRVPSSTGARESMLGAIIAMAVAMTVLLGLGLVLPTGVRWESNEARETAMHVIVVLAVLGFAGAMAAFAFHLRTLAIHFRDRRLGDLAMYYLAFLMAMVVWIFLSMFAIEDSNPTSTTARTLELVFTLLFGIAHFGALYLLVRGTLSHIEGSLRSTAL